MPPAAAPARMTPQRAAEIADEQIAHWQRNGITPDDAWRALGLAWAWAVTWREVRTQLIRYQIVGRFSDAHPELARLADAA